MNIRTAEEAAALLAPELREAQDELNTPLVMDGSTQQQHREQQGKAAAYSCALRPPLRAQ